MHCVICKHGTTQPGKTVVTLDRENCIIVFKDVPADICQNCGEYYLNDTVTQQILEQAEFALSKGAEVEVRRYAA
jgi:YgiT-type zinc finger domain-containing protein